MLFPSGSTARADTAFDFVAWARGIPNQLYRPHYVYGTITLSANNERSIEFVRLTGAIPIPVGTATAATVTSAFELYEAVIAAYPSARVVLSLYGSYWNATNTPAYNPTDTASAGSIAESARIVARAAAIAGWVADENAARSLSVPVAASLVDSEDFSSGQYRSDRSLDMGGTSVVDWDAAITARHDEIITAQSTAFPGIKFYHYDRGAIIWRADDAFAPGWIPHAYYSEAYDETGGPHPFGVALYDLADMGSMIRKFELTAAAADTASIVSVVPWIAFGSGLPHRESWPYSGDSWLWDYPIPSVNYWEMGALINNRARHQNDALWGAWRRADAVCIYPSVFDSRCYRDRAYRAFAAYCCGAYGIQAIPTTQTAERIWPRRDEGRHLQGAPSGYPDSEFIPASIAGLVADWELSPATWTDVAGSVTESPNLVAGVDPLVDGTTAPTTSNPDVSTTDGEAGALFEGAAALTCNAIASTFDGDDTAVSVYLVLAWRDRSGTQFTYAFTGGDSRHGATLGSTTASGSRRDAGGTYATACAATFSTEDRFVVLADRYGAAVRTLAVGATEPVTRAQDVGACAFTAFTLGAFNAGGTSGINASIRRCIVYSAALSDADDQLLRRYLAQRYGAITY